MPRAALSAAAIAAASISPILSVVHADAVPVSRDSTVTSFSYMYNPFGNGYSSTSDGTTTFDAYTGSLGTPGYSSATQTSSISATGAYASVYAAGRHNGSVMQAAYSGGTSTFTYIFDLTAPAPLTITGSVSHSSMWAFGYGSVRLYNDVTGTLLFEQMGAGSTPDMLTIPFATVYNAEPGRCRFVVSASQSGSSALPSQLLTHSAQATLMIPTPTAAAMLPLAAFAALRRRRR